MHILEEAFISLLYDSLPIHNKYIYTGSRYIPEDNTPCVTIQLADESFIRKQYTEIDNIQYIRRLYNASVWINVWCNTEEERTSLINAIRLRLNQVEAYHYSTCSNYDSRNCKQTGNVCEALDSHGTRANKNKCPDISNFTSFFENYNIPQRSFHVNSVTDLDEYDSSETILRTIFRLEMNYYSFYNVGGRLFDSIKFKERLL